ncbi:hypothetical protein [Thiothrix eikelboomii]|uniref:hypothetical protein n=1 Tax=Thiothrix eikelboomii TaxID=92487 RepID=UPI003BB06167
MSFSNNSLATVRISIVEDAFKDAADVAPEKRDDWADVQNYIQALNYAVTRLETLPLSNRLLREAHATLLQGVRGATKQTGEFRTRQNWIGVSLKGEVSQRTAIWHVPLGFHGLRWSAEQSGVAFAANQGKVLVFTCLFVDDLGVMI